MSFEIFWICLRLLQNTIEWFRTLRPISGGMDGWDGRLSPFDGLLRAPTVLIIKKKNYSKVNTSNYYTAHQLLYSLKII